jgi:hypothetical protein
MIFFDRLQLVLACLLVVLSSSIYFHQLYAGKFLYEVVDNVAFFVA